MINEITHITVINQIINKIKHGEKLEYIEAFILSIILYGTAQQLIIALANYISTLKKI